MKTILKYSLLALALSLTTVPSRASQLRTTVRKNCSGS